MLSKDLNRTEEESSQCILHPLASILGLFLSKKKKKEKEKKKEKDNGQTRRNLERK